VNSPAASLRIKNGLRTNCFGRTVQFVKSDPFVTIGQLPSCGTYALHSVQYRQFSVSTAANSGNNVVPVSFVGGPRGIGELGMMTVYSIASKVKYSRGEKYHVWHALTCA
jgi:hypothetical protein